MLFIWFVALAAGAAFSQERPEPKTPVPPPPFAPSDTFNIWPGAAPDETGDRGPEYMLVERRRPFYQIADVSVPTRPCMTAVPAVPLPSCSLNW